MYIKIKTVLDKITMLEKMMEKNNDNPQVTLVNAQEALLDLEEIIDSLQDLKEEFSNLVDGYEDEIEEELEDTQYETIYEKTMGNDIMRVSTSIKIGKKE